MGMVLGRGCILRKEGGKERERERERERELARDGVNGQRRKDLANEFGFPAISTTARIVFCFLHDLHHSGGFPDIIYLHPCQLPRSAGKELRGISRLLLLARGGVLDVVSGGGEGTRSGSRRSKRPDFPRSTHPQAEADAMSRKKMILFLLSTILLHFLCLSVRQQY